MQRFIIIRIAVMPPSDFMVRKNVKKSHSKITSFKRK